jgi:hypothetical protein
LFKAGQVVLDEVREAKELLLPELDGFGSTCPECNFETVSNLWRSGLSNERGIHVGGDIRQGFDRRVLGYMGRF